ncbi:MAG: response regulator [Bacteroidota bacterium]|nr:response regulator [Bacteroidota bacterium]
MKKFLTIEDERTIQDLYMIILNKAFPDYKLFQAFNGEEGLEIVFSELPDIILVDIRLPGIDGFEICKTIKSDSRSKDIPIIMVSALGDDVRVRVKALKSGADFFLTKPFNKTEFLGLVGVMLRISNSEEILRQNNHELDQYIQLQSRGASEDISSLKQISGYDRHFFWETDENRRLVFFSAGAESVIGYSSAELVGQEVTQYGFFSGIDWLGVFRDVECQCRNKSNQEIWLSMSGFPIYDANDKFLGFRGLSHNITDRKRAQFDLEQSLKEIEAYQDRIKLMNNALTRAEERERRKISEYLHDSLGATLALANMKLSTLQNSQLEPGDQKLLKETSEILAHAISDSRSVIYELSPPMLYELGLVPTLRWKLKQVEEQGGLVAKLECNTDFQGIDNEFLIFVYRIISELLLNTLKHAHADRVVVRLNIQQNILIIEVHDNGEGMDSKFLCSNEKKTSFGLFNMNERIDSLGGSLRIESESGQFTRTIIRLPVQS